MQSRAAALEPGILLSFRIYVFLTALGPLYGLSVWRMADPGNLRAQLQTVLATDGFFTAFLLIYTSRAWFRQRLGRAFFPVALIVQAAHPIAGHYAIMAVVPAALLEQYSVMSLARLSVHATVLVIFVAWQYELGWPLSLSVGLAALHAAIGWPHVNTHGELFPMYITIISTQSLVTAGSGLAVGLLMRSQRRQAAMLDERNRKLAEYATAAEQLAITQERNRLARELHDTLAHSLSAVAVQIEAAQALSEIDAVAGHKMMGQALHTTREGLTEARRSLHALRASPLEDLGLALAVRSLAESVASRAGLHLALHIGSHLENLRPEVEQCLYRVAQEALANVARHANATSVQVALSRDDGHVRLSVSDNGRGFDPAAAGETRYGLRGLRERTDTIGGTLLVESEIDKGSTVALELTIGRKAK